MKYRNLKSADRPVSLLGLGTLRFPRNSDGSIDEETSIDILRTSIDSGINYIDTAYTYHNGQSETTVGKALKDGYREKVILADKMPVWLAKDEAHVKEIFRTQMERLDTGFIDMYLVHSVNAGSWKKAGELNVMPFLLEMKAQGKIGHIGFSFHDSYEVFRKVLSDFPWEFCQIQLNYMDRDFQAGVKGLRLAADKGIDVIIMEPLKGGRLAGPLPPSVAELWDRAEKKRSPAEWALKWLAAQPEVSLILSGMNSREQISDNIRILSAPDADILTENERMLISEVSKEYNRLIRYSCTGCEYCLPCPAGLDIPDLIAYYNQWNTYGHNPSIKAEYTGWISEGRHASDCLGCHECERKCPQGLPVTQALKDTARTFGL